MPWQSPFQQAALKGWKKIPNHREFNLIIQGISDEESISHLFTVDIEFDRENSVEKTLLFNEIYKHFFEKKMFFRPTSDPYFNFLSRWDWTIKEHWICTKQLRKLIRQWTRNFSYLFMQNISIFC